LVRFEASEFAVRRSISVAGDHEEDADASLLLSNGACS
jgi:hypothetical protein